MKKAEEYLKPYKKYLVEGVDGYKNISGNGMFIRDVENAIKQAQQDTIDATVKICAKEAKIQIRQYYNNELIIIEDEKVFFEVHLNY